MEENKSAVKPRKRSSMKFILGLFVGLLLLCCSGVILFAWFGGYVKSGICSSVMQDSDIFRQFNCSTTENVSNTENKFPLESLNLNKLFDQGFTNEQQAVAAVVEKVNSGVVGIGVLVDNFSGENELIGTGFLVSRAGLIVSNRHVVESETQTYFILFKGEEEPVEVSGSNIYRDPINDIALIRIDPSKIPAEATVIPIGDSDKLKIGDTVIAIGNPLGTFTGTVTKGIISGLNREVTISRGFFNSSSQVYQDVIQTDAAINPGNSGGPLLNIFGEVVGVNFATIEGASNLSFALPINRIKLRIAELEEFGKFRIPYMGVEYRTRMVFLRRQSIVGAEILTVVPGSPAAESGLRVGDVILEFNGKSLDSANLTALIQQTKIGDTVRCIVLRNGEQLELRVVIGER